MRRFSLASLLSWTIVASACSGHSKSPAPVPILKVEEANLPYQVLRAEGGRELTKAEFFGELNAAQAICVGESHTDSHHHWAQLQVLENLVPSGQFATGMEMFQRPFQGVLDDFSEGRISEEHLLTRSDWKRRWKYDWGYYAPMIRYTVSKGGALLALNVSKELKDKWKKGGVEGLSEEEKLKIPEMNLDDDKHRKWFRTLMESMSEGHEKDAGAHAFVGDPEPAVHSAPASATHDPVAATAPAATAPAATAPAAEADFIDQIYPVQVLWDETMADSASRWLQAEAGRQLVILAGNGHCHNSAIVARMKRRGVERVVSVRPVVETGDGETAELLAQPENDYLFVMSK